MTTSLDIALRRPTARFAGLALFLGALGVTLLSLPVTIENLPPQLRTLPPATQRSLLVGIPWTVLLFAAALGAVAVRVARSTSFRVLVRDGQLCFPSRMGSTMAFPLGAVVSITCNAVGDHVVILARGHRYLLPWFVMPAGTSPRQLAQELAKTLTGAPRGDAATDR